MATKTLLEVCESEKNIELMMIKTNNISETVPEADIATVVKAI